MEVALVEDWVPELVARVSWIIRRTPSMVTVALAVAGLDIRDGDSGGGLLDDAVVPKMVDNSSWRSC